MQLRHIETKSCYVVDNNEIPLSRIKTKYIEREAKMPEKMKNFPNFSLRYDKENILKIQK